VLLDNVQAKNFKMKLSQFAKSLSNTDLR
jgi:hypothetical protein